MAIKIVFEDSETYQSIALSSKKLILGRSRTKAQILITDPMCSSRHASLEIANDGSVILSDLDSTNGTYINESLLTTSMRVYIDDVIRIGDTRFWLDKEAMNSREIQQLSSTSNKTSFTQLELNGMQVRPKNKGFESPKKPIPTRRTSQQYDDDEDENEQKGLVGKLKGIFRR